MGSVQRRDGRIFKGENLVIDNYDLDFVMKNVIQSVEINYLSESLFNEEIFIQTGADRNNDGFYNHSVFRTAGNKELCRIRIG